MKIKVTKGTKTPEKVLVFETIGFTLEGITVYVSIDYKNRHISLVDKDGKAKQWLFAMRTSDYLAGWQRILSAMKYAVEQAEARLNEQPDMLETLLMEEALFGKKHKGDV